MRQFLLRAHDAPAEPTFSLNDLPGDGGRMDLLCRAVGAGLFTSHGIRDARVHLVVGDVTVEFDGETARNLNPDARSTAARVRDALDSRADAIGHQPAEVSPGVKLYRTGLADTLDRLDGHLVQLHEDGSPLPEASPPADPIFVLSDHRDFTDEEATLLAERADDRLRVGPRAIHADHTVAVVHNWLDTDGYTAYGE
ncbi:tRNA (pseudouridine(54)-N(1))-methyltransferase TrmY [Halobaculum sp. MBLA0143]|uniref:tRNA (pseudouridine(54)-N(1))-methyltransferase TrmY n=1 Tax=Halobaculum sp. MBLA0143 TaxID=3079933 RepID=UPI003525CF44